MYLFLFQFEIILLTCGTIIIANVVPAEEKLTA